MRKSRVRWRIFCRGAHNDKPEFQGFERPIGAGLQASSRHHAVHRRHHRRRIVRRLGACHRGGWPGRHAGLSVLRPAGRAGHAHARGNGGGQPRYRVFLYLRRPGHRALGRLYHRLALLVVLGPGDSHRGAGCRPCAAPMVSPDRCLAVRPGLDHCVGGDQSVQRVQVRGVRILVRHGQGGGDHRFHRRGFCRADGLGSRSGSQRLERSDGRTRRVRPQRPVGGGGRVHHHHVQLHRDRGGDHRRRRIRQSLAEHCQGHAFGDLAHRRVLPVVDFRGHLRGALERSAAGFRWVPTSAHWNS